MKTSEMIGKFYSVDYFPNKLTYVLSIENGLINVLYFCNEKGKGLKAIKTQINIAQKRELKVIKHCFNPTDKTMNLINEHKQTNNL